MRSQGSLMRLAWSSRLLYSSSSHSRCRVLSGSLSCTGIDTFDRSLPMLLRSMFHRLTSAPGPLAAGRQRRRGGPAALPATHTPGVPRSRHHSLASRRGRPAGWPTARLPPTPSPSLRALWGRAAGNLILDKLPGGFRWAAGKPRTLEALCESPPLPPVPSINRNRCQDVDHSAHFIDEETVSNQESDTFKATLLQSGKGEPLPSPRLSGPI